MPIYEYKCLSCGHIFEILTTSGKSLDKIQCEKCHGSEVSKLLSAGSIRSGSTTLPSAAPPSCGNRSGFS